MWRRSPAGCVLCVLLIQIRVVKAFQAGLDRREPSLTGQSAARLREISRQLRLQVENEGRSQLLWIFDNYCLIPCSGPSGALLIQWLIVVPSPVTFSYTVMLGSYRRFTKTSPLITVWDFVGCYLFPPFILPLKQVHLNWSELPEGEPPLLGPWLCSEVVQIYYMTIM